MASKFGPGYTVEKVAAVQEALRLIVEALEGVTTILYAKEASFEALEIYALFFTLKGEAYTMRYSEVLNAIEAWPLYDTKVVPDGLMQRIEKVFPFAIYASVDVPGRDPIHNWSGIPLDTLLDADYSV